MLNKRTCILPGVCFLILSLFGCSNLIHRWTKTEHRVDNGSLEGRVDDLAGKMNLVVSDANMLHNEVEITKTYNTIMQQKIDGLEAMIRDLTDQINRLHLPVTVPEIAPTQKNTSVVTNVVVSDSEPSLAQTSDVQITENTGGPLAVARQFWNTINTNDIQSVRLFSTKESGNRLLTIDGALANHTTTFGEAKVNENKATIPTVVQAQRGTTMTETRMQTVLVEEDGQWKVDVGQTMASMPGGIMDTIAIEADKTMEEGSRTGAEETEKSPDAAMQEGIQEMPQTNETLTAVTPPAQESTGTTAVDDQTDTAGSPENPDETGEMSEASQEDIPPKQEAIVISEESTPAQREAFLKENIVRLAEAEFPDQKGTQWNILSLEHKAHLTYAEVEPTPAIVGYQRLKFAVSFRDPGTPRVIGIYGFTDGQYRLLSTKKH
ncbi:MAG: hypothetical protein B6D35_03020 [Candidatus Brocadia sp. UTAMX2]|nr:MAG: hypothetical protein B6D35_03020 [Candidatus Brocadia sp. UTAMX2]